MEEVFVNIIINALEAMGENGDLILKTARCNDSIIISNKDTGPGIREPDINGIFEPYYTTKDKKGTGLGLSRHCGKISVRNNTSGRGAEFQITLPAK